MSSTELAIERGVPAVPEGAHRPWPHYTVAERRAALSVLEAQADDVGGPHSRFVREFEAAFADYCGATYCRAVGSGTDALWAALVAAGVDETQSVIVPALSYAATGQAVALTGAEIIWGDIDSGTFNLDPEKVDTLVRPNTTAILPVHTHGLMADMGALLDIAERYGLAVIEDAAQAAGATQGGRKAGTLGVSGAFSTNVKKVLQCGDGGLHVTDDADLHETVVSLTGCGENVSERPGPDDLRAHRALGLGRVSRMNPLAAAVGLEQLKRLPEFLATAEANMAILRAGIGELPGFMTPYVPEGSTSTHHLVRVKLDPEFWGWNGPSRLLRDGVIRVLRDEGVHVGTWQEEPLPEMPAFRMGKRVAPYRPGLTPPLDPFDPKLYQVTCDVLDMTIVLGRTPYTMHVQTPELMGYYVTAFQKMVDNRSAIRRHCRRLRVV